MPTIEDFKSLDIRVGRITRAEPTEDLRIKAYHIEVDFGKILGRRRSVAQVTDFYEPKDLIGRQVVGVLGLSPKRIGKYTSEVLLLGVGTDKGVALLNLDRDVPEGLIVS